MSATGQRSGNEIRRFTRKRWISIEQSPCTYITTAPPRVPFGKSCPGEVPGRANGPGGARVYPVQYKLPARIKYIPNNTILVYFPFVTFFGHVRTVFDAPVSIYGCTKGRKTLRLYTRFIYARTYGFGSTRTSANQLQSVLEEFE